MAQNNSSKEYTRIFREQYNSIEKHPEKEKIALAMLDFAFTGKYTQLDDWGESIMELLKRQLFTNTQSESWGGHRDNAGRKKNQDEIKMINQDEIKYNVIVTDNVNDNKGGMGGKEDCKKSNPNILYLGEMKLVKLTEEENKKVMIKCHGSGRPEPSARYVLAIRKINAWMAAGTKATERYKPVNKTHYGLFADGNWIWDGLDYDIEKQKKFSEMRNDWLESINFIKGDNNDNK